MEKMTPVAYAYSIKGHSFCRAGWEKAETEKKAWREARKWARAVVNARPIVYPLYPLGTFACPTIVCGLEIDAR